MTQHIAHQGPTIATHQAEKVDLPKEPEEDFDDRPDEPTPSLWQRSVKVFHNVSKREAVVVRVDWSMNMFRAFYTDERSPDGTMGRFGTRREWENCRDWTVATTFLPAELERREAARQLEEALLQLDEKDAALVAILCDDPDPNKNFAKMMALRVAGMIKWPAGADTKADAKAKAK